MVEFGASSPDEPESYRKIQTVRVERCGTKFREVETLGSDLSLHSDFALAVPCSE
jgi:hypothetical protein